MAGKPALTIADLPRLLAAVVEVDPERTALSDGDALLSYARLQQEITTLDSAMGGILGFDALLPVVLSNLAPGLLGGAGLPAVVDSLLDDAAEVLGDAAGAPATADPGTLVARFDAQDSYVSLDRHEGGGLRKDRQAVGERRGEDHDEDGAQQYQHDCRGRRISRLLPRDGPFQREILRRGGDLPQDVGNPRGSAARPTGIGGL